MNRATPIEAHGRRDWVVRAYGRAVARLFAALVVTFSLYLSAGFPRVAIAMPVSPLEPRLAAEWARLFGFDVAQPVVFQFLDFLVSRLTSPLAVGPFVVAGVVALALDARGRA
ncbi:hypothetical protein C475_00687 [Halosimplex carlsbadense 2-9-1]|uniref:Uncharacterized protein n=1 Tax=Halosimplex carlsbadense 2-9-1 TaxID=797114 RepID=M0D3U8_9EURY|nr:hypothetical protein [Halosimplex carlsbadense]ELZ30206.1 hypothetical protein C475_00687 [Halosimplex carlsbadense 2-9-1]